MKPIRSYINAVSMKGRIDLRIAGLFLFLISGNVFAQSIDSVQSMKEVEVLRKQAPRMELATQNVELISALDLKSDACCNLSESFMRTGAVDVQYSDGVSGTKEIRMLGLDGSYIQTMYENMPGIRGLNSTYGMEYLPGPWIKSIQINKGAGSVVNGYEAITGQINLELQKPQNAEKIFANVYINQDAKIDIDAHYATKLKNKPWYTLGLIHAANNWVMMDFNKDGFVDNPLFNRVSAMNRWFHVKKDGGMILFMGNLSAEDRTSGQSMFNPRVKPERQRAWGSRLKTLHADFLAKTAFNFSNEQNIGLQYRYAYHEQDGFIGLKRFSGKEHFGYFNAIYLKEINHDNVIKLGASVQTNFFEERFDTFIFKRLEIVPGVFAEATIKPIESLTIVGGLRVDQHNLFGPFLSPRLHVKYDILYDLSLRVGGGRGYRVPNLINENYSFLFSNRQINIGLLQPEIAWNYGASLAYKFNLDFREGFIHIDFYRTDFERQMITDVETPGLLDVYLQKGKSFSNSLQADVSYEIIRNVNLKLSYKWDHVMVNYKSGMKIQAFRPQHKLLMVADYDWKKIGLMATSNLAWYAPGRVPQVADANTDYTFQPISRHLFIWNMQLTKKIKKQWEVYVGAENILNQRQSNPVINADRPFSEQFDATMIWGPIRGAMAYAGFRVTLE